jgi:chaperonin cofactor prefoldin
MSAKKRVVSPVVAKATTKAAAAAAVTNAKTVRITSVAVADKVAVQLVAVTKSLPENHPMVKTVKNLLARVDREKGNISKAEDLAAKKAEVKAKKIKAMQAKIDALQAKITEVEAD